MRLHTVGLVMILALAHSICVVPLAVEAQPPAEVWRLGFLSGEPPTESLPVVVPFFERLRALGYVEGQNLTIERRWAEPREHRLPDLAAELVQLRVNCIVAVTWAAVRAAKQATTTIPIVMIINSDPVEGGLVTSLARPGGNITGFSPMTPELAGKRLELLREVVPGLTYVAVLWEPAVPAKAIEFSKTQVAAQVLGIQVRSLEVRSPDDFEAAFAATTREHAGALLTLGSPMTVVNRTRIIDFAARTRLPTMYDKKEFVQDGGLIAYMPSEQEKGERTASYVDRILKGAKPTDLPVEQPTRFELVINLKTAQAIGLTIPPTLLFQADEVIR
jgi:putative tryptophan/tyrosine transport system substrate-binding protein